MKPCTECQDYDDWTGGGWCNSPNNISGYNNLGYPIRKRAAHNINKDCHCSWYRKRKGLRPSTKFSLGLLGAWFLAMAIIALLGL
jgi:hypothetical protein